eukprot:4697605-Amphidinium_carterae.1
MTALSQWSTVGNAMTGNLPEEGLRGAEFNGLSVAANLHTGSVPCALLEQGHWEIIATEENHFTGTLCAEGVRGMTKIGYALILSGNRFSGTLAARGAAKSLPKYMLNANNFSGTLPDAILRLLGLVVFLVQDNFFQGALPAVASMWTLVFYDVSHNLLTGTVPQGVGAQPDLRVFMSAGVRKSREVCIPIFPR